MDTKLKSNNEEKSEEKTGKWWQFFIEERRLVGACALLCTAFAALVQLFGLVASTAFAKIIEENGVGFYDYLQDMDRFYFLGIVFFGIFAAVLWLRPNSRLRQSPPASLAPEISLIGILAALDYNWESNYMMFVDTGNHFFGRIGFVAGLFVNTFAMAFMFLLVFIAVASAMQIKDLGFKNYLQQRSFVFLFWQRYSPNIKRACKWLTDIDFTEKTDRAIIKIVLLNLVVTAAFCSAWFFGIVGLVLYSGLLYVVLKKGAQKIKTSHAALLNATGQMAQGRLDVHIDEDLGIFTPLGKELVKVQEGFNLAVKEHTKSQRMKTELISNVSHDLKTPLTAIITYVNLLKQENITDEERKSYVQTLDIKSQRLKSLIEDLFEMSKASSGNIVLHPTKVDLPALVRQVELEASDALNTAQIEFRYNFPQSKIELMLDGEKTSRIFENLIMNVAKYAMPGTRAYVSIVAGEKLVTLEMKNVSKNELSFDSTEITERFMRGDTARSSEGSGLGLAIAKSFAEAQGAQFKIVTDGDMFKVYLTFTRIDGQAVPQSTNSPKQTNEIYENIAVEGFVSQDSSSFKTPSQAFAAQNLQDNVPQYPFGYPTGKHHTPPEENQQRPQNIGDMTLNQMADAAANAANSAVNAVANAARQAAEKAKLAGQATKEEVAAAKIALKMARIQAKEAARQFKKEQREMQKNARYGGAGYTAPPYQEQNVIYVEPILQAEEREPNWPVAETAGAATAKQVDPQFSPPPTALQSTQFVAPDKVPPAAPQEVPKEAVEIEELIKNLPKAKADFDGEEMSEKNEPAPSLSPILELYPMPELLDEER